MEEEGRAGGLSALWGLMIPCPKELDPTWGSAFQCLGAPGLWLTRVAPWNLVEPCHQVGL